MEARLYHASVERGGPPRFGLRNHLAASMRVFVMNSSTARSSTRLCEAQIVIESWRRHYNRNGKVPRGRDDEELLSASGNW
jgi:hypothetical protein